MGMFVMFGIFESLIIYNYNIRVKYTSPILQSYSWTKSI